MRIGEGKDSDDALIVTVKLESGRFDSTIRVPLFATAEQRDKFIGAWFKLMEEGIKMGVPDRKEDKDGSEVH